MSIWKCMQFRHFRLEHSNYLDVKMAKKKLGKWQKIISVSVWEISWRQLLVTNVSLFPCSVSRKIQFQFHKGLKKALIWFLNLQIPYFLSVLFSTRQPFYTTDLCLSSWHICLFFYPFCCLFLDKVSACFTSHFHQKVIYFLFCPCFSLIMCYQCLCFHVTSC